MKKLFGFLTIISVLVFGFKECGASIPKTPLAPSDFFEKREVCQEEVIIKIINYTNRQISCLFIYGGKRAITDIGSGKFFCFQVKNPYCYNLPTCSKATIIIWATDCQDTVIAIVANELIITFSGLSPRLFPREETLIILPRGEDSLKLERR